MSLYASKKNQEGSFAYKMQEKRRTKIRRSGVNNIKPIICGDETGRQCCIPDCTNLCELKWLHPMSCNCKSHQGNFE